MKLLVLLTILISTTALFAKGTVTGGHFSVQSLSTSKDETIIVSELKKPLVVIFISKDCPCSKGNLSYIDQLSREYPAFRFLGVHAKKGTPSQEVNNYLRDKNLGFEVFNDPSLLAASKFNALKTPHAYIVNSSGEILYSGGISNSTFPKNAKEFYLKNALEDVKNHRPVAKYETKTLGCFIVR